MTAVKPCKRCGSSGLLSLPLPSRSQQKRLRSRGERVFEQKLCPDCGGESNPQLMAAIGEERREAARAEAHAKMRGQDKHRALAAKRKRQRAAKRKGRR